MTVAACSAGQACRPCACNPLPLLLSALHGLTKSLSFSILQAAPLFFRDRTLHFSCQCLTKVDGNSSKTRNFACTEGKTVSNIDSYADTLVIKPCELRTLLRIPLRSAQPPPHLPLPRTVHSE